MEIMLSARRIAVMAPLVLGIWHAQAAAQTDAPAPAAAPPADASAAFAPRMTSIPVPGAGAFGSALDMHAQVFVPPGPGPFPVVVFSHGRAGDVKVRAGLRNPIQLWHAKYWVDRGVAVVASVRAGYGETGGPDGEGSGARFDFSGQCTSSPDFKGVAQRTNRALLATLDWVRHQPWADSQRIVLEGQSVGGFATVSAASLRPAGVIGYINFSGGAGGSPDRAPGHSCDPDQMRDLMAAFGKTVAVPGLWLYAGNDQYWGPDAPQAWYRAFTAGGSQARMVAVPEVPGHDGHQLLGFGRKFWRNDLDRFVQELGL